MAEQPPNKLAAILWFVAAALALTAAVLRYTESGEIKWPLLAAAVFLGAMGVGLAKRS